MRSISAGSWIFRIGQHRTRNTIAATSNALIVPNDQLPSHSVAGTTPASKTARKTRKRHGPMLLPMVRGLAMARNLVAAWCPSSERLNVHVPWLWLIIGGLFEVGFTTTLRFVDGFR